MKKSRFASAFFAFTITFAVLTGCSDDTLNGASEPLTKDEVRYMKVAIVSPDQGTRAADFENATAEEQAVNNLYMDFYDSDGTFVKRVTQANITPEATSGGNVGLTTAIVQIDLQKGQKAPSYVMCYINTVAGNDTPPAMSALRTTEKTEFMNDKGFVMSNSVYFGSNPVSGGTDVKISGTPINADDLHKTEADAAASTTSYVDIYVERYAAKVKFTANTTNQTGAFSDESTAAGIYPFAFNIDNTNLGTMIFTPEAWTINAESQSMYVVKNFAESSPNADTPDMSTISNYLKPWMSEDGSQLWNDATNHRSYWSCSPSFYATDFPVVSDDITDIAAGTTSPYMLNYHSYNDITGSNGCGNTSFTASDEIKPYLYSMENTVGSAVTTISNPKAAAPSVVIVGNYQIKYGDSDTDLITPNTTFYYFNNRVFFDATPNYATGTPTDNAKLIINEFLNYQQILYVRNGDIYTLLSSGNAGGNLVVTHPDKEARDENKLPMRAVTLQLKAVPTGENALYIKSGTGYTPVTAKNLNEVNQSLLNTLGVADCYMNGKGFFSIPIQHLGMTESQWTSDTSAEAENTYPNPISDTGAIDWTKVHPGDFGLVRNHVYDLSVSAIRGRATAISDLEAPIVPQPEIDSYWIKYRINVLNWRIVPTQDQIIL